MNIERTKAYIMNAGNVCADGDLRTQMKLTCDCEPLHYYFNTEEVAQPITYVDPITDLAPWYDPGIPESSGFLGFMIEEVVQNAISVRRTNTRVSSSGGGVLGPLRSKERRLDFTVLMFACNEISMEYGFRYLTDALGTPGCNGDCLSLCDAEYRDSCPDTDGSSASLNRGRWMLKNVGLVEGPVWGENPLSGSTCNIRRVTFSLVSEMPWKFKAPVVECLDLAFEGYPADGASCVNWSDILCGEREVSCSVEEPLLIGETGLILEINSGSSPLQHIRIAIRPDSLGYECDPNSAPPGYVRVDPTDLIYIPWMPADSQIIYDTSVETITITTPTITTPVNALPYVSTNEGEPPTYPTLRCGAFCVSVSASECSVVGAPTVTIKSVHREI